MAVGARVVNLAIGLAIGLAPVSMSPADGQQRLDLVIDNTTVIDPDSRQVLVNHSVYIQDGRIHSVVPAGDRSAKARKRVDGRGRFLIPGLNDMHVHLNMAEIRTDPTTTLQLLLAHGITGVREMSSDCWEPRRPGDGCLDTMREIVRQIEDGERAGPRLLALASHSVAGVWERDRLPEGAAPFLAPETAEEGAELARYLKERDVDLVKIYNTVNRSSYFGLVAEANRIGLEVSGHLPFGVSLVEASNAGQRTIEHARDLPLACSTYGNEYRSIMERVIHKEDIDPPSAEERLRKSLEGYDETLCLQVLATLKTNATILVPTHGTREMDARAADPAYRNDPRWAQIPPALQAKWNRDLDNTAAVAPTLAALFQEFYEQGLRLTAKAHQAGVTILAGTDANDTMIFPGSSLHDELARFAQAGLDPMDILITATTAPATYLGLSQDLGGITPGKRADLVLLRANPLEDIDNARQIEAVIQAGQLHTRKQLNKTLREIEKSVAQAKRDQPEPESN